MWPTLEELPAAPVTRRKRRDEGDVESASSYDESPRDKRSDDGVMYPIALGLLLIFMIVLALYTAASPQSNQHQWLHVGTDLRRRPLAQREQQAPPPQPAASPTPGSSETVRVRCETTKGELLIDVHVDWAPLGARRFLDMVTQGFFETRVALFRAVPGFLCQTGVAGDPAVHRAWRQRGAIKDDKQWLTGRRPMKRGFLSFAGSGPNSRSTEFFFAYKDIQLGGSPWEVPFGKLVGEQSFDTLDAFYTGYGDMPAFGGRAPVQAKMYQQGLKYLEPNYPDIDYIQSCAILAKSTALEW